MDDHAASGSVNEGDAWAWASRLRRARRRWRDRVLRPSATDEREAFAALHGGRYMCVRLDKRCWLEVEDRQHRYAKNLRRYHFEWLRLERPGGSFWAWLEKAPTLPTCGRDKLETEVVSYCETESERQRYALRCVHGRLWSQLCDDDDATSSPPLSPHGSRERPRGGWGRLNTGPKGWIFVLRDGVLYARRKSTRAGVDRFHHSSFFGGECVDAAGLIIACDGVVTKLLPHSGHYRPREAILARLLHFLQDCLGLDLAQVEVDVQRLVRQARPEHARKVATPLFVSAREAHDFLVHKAMAKTTNLLRDIEARSFDADATPGENAPPKSPHTPHRPVTPLGRAASRANLRADQLEIEERMHQIGLGVKPPDDVALPDVGSDEPNNVVRQVCSFDDDDDDADSLRPRARSFEPIGTFVGGGETTAQPTTQLSVSWTSGRPPTRRRRSERRFLRRARRAYSTPPGPFGWLSRRAGSDDARNDPASDMSSSDDDADDRSSDPALSSDGSTSNYVKMARRIRSENALPLRLAIGFASITGASEFPRSNSKSSLSEFGDDFLFSNRPSASDWAAAAVPLRDVNARVASNHDSMGDYDDTIEFRMDPPAAHTPLPPANASH